MGDGVRQFTSLLRKNVLLKCRRPCATAFEIALPLVLFLLLVYVRTVYETVWYGPFYYRNHVLTPFGAASVNELDSKALRDNGAPWAPWFDKQSAKLPDEDSGLLSFSQLAIGEGLCSREFKNTVADGLEAVLSFRLASGLTLADELLRLDPLVVGNAMTEGIDTAYKFLTDGAAPSLGASLRQDFFASGLDGSVKEVGDRLQTEINTLASLLDAADGPAQAGQLAEGWYREACATNASALVGTNVTALTNLLYDLGQALEAAGVASLLQPGVLNQSVLNQLQNLTVFTPNSSLVSVISNITQANDDLNFSGLFSLLDGLAESELDRFNVNADQLDSFLQQLQALNDLGLNTVAVEGLLGSAALSSFGLASGGTNTDMSGLLQTLLGGAGGLTANLNLLAIAFQQIRDLRPILQTFDQIMWWTSHFLQSSSLTTLVFGEVPFTMRNIPLRQGSPLNGMREDDGGQQAFSTEAAYQLQQVIRTLQTQVVPAFLGAEAASLTGLLDPSGLGAGLQGLPLEPAFRDLQSFVSRITNTTRAEIETSVVPSILNGSLETGACGPGAAEAVGQLIARTHERCPFYRAVIPQLARGSLTSAVQTSLESFRTFDFDQLDEDMKSFANTTLPLTLNESILEVLVRTQADFGYKPRVYEKTDWQKNCPDGSVIQTPAECKIAAVQMGKQWEGTTYLEGGHEYCVWSYNDKVSFNLAVQNFSKVDAMHPYAAFGSVCKTEKWQNYTKIYELVGAGFCRPPGCHPEAPSCRVNGYYGNGASLLDCRRRCEVDANCIGFSFLPSDDFGQVSGCFVHTNDTYVPPEWISYRKRYFSIGGASGTSTALCYRVVQKDPTLPATGGCYYKQPTVGNGRCSGPHLTWNPDYWGRENVWSWEDEARCLVRKINHDAYCETNTTWLFVLDTSNQTFVPQVTPRTVAERLTWLSTKELLKSLELPRCNDVPFEPRLANSGNSDGRRRRGRGGRRLQEQADYIRDYLGRRKVLVAPYKGEVKELIDMLTVEALLSAVEDSTSGRKTNIVEGLPGLFMQCPLVRGMSASSALQLFEDDLLFMESAEAVQDFARRQPDDVLLAVVFNSADAEGNFPATLDVDFSIRAHAQLLPPTSRIIRQSRDGGFFGFRNFYFYPYYELGFAQMEEAVGIATARLQARREARQRRSSRSVVGVNAEANTRTQPGRRMKVLLEQFPVGRTELDNFFVIIQFFMPMLMVLGWIYAVSLMVREVVYEKQERLKDVMRIQGLKTWVYWFSWLTSGMVQLTGLVTILVLMLSIGQVVQFSDPTVLFSFFWLYSLSTVSFAMFVSSFFSRAKVAAAFGGLLYWMAYMPSALFNQFEETLPFDAKNAFCLMSPTALGVGMLYIGKWETLDTGAQWSNLWVAPPVTTSGAAPSDTHSLGNVFGMLVLDSIIYQVLAWYVEKVRPGTLGLPQPWYFPFLPSYWRPPKQELAIFGVGSGNEQSGNQLLECWEEPSQEVASKVSVQIRDLTKTFANGKQALKGITLDMHEGTIMGLLGHNGAGKSTTMSIMTGLYPPSSGDAIVNGISVRGDSLGVRRQLGVCLQHNALYENVTVEEHLTLFCRLKSVPANEVADEVNRLLRDTGMEVKRRAPSRALSGGMKRKLSIAIALAGGSKVVTLDEPTAGVDATARRDIWHLLVKYKAGRTILLSTHFMDEADILSDRIAIIAEGRLTAIASSMALKRFFADGYMLTVVCDDHSDGQRVAPFVLGTVPQSSFAGARGREFCFALPFNSRAIFALLFEKLQDSKIRKELKINAYGLSAASMEEVFLKASSVHEKGLHGQVRNLTFTPDLRDPSTTEGRPVLPFSAGIFEPSDGQVLERDEKANTPKAGDSIGATPVVLGLPIGDRRENAAKVLEDEQDHPRSPQCMSSYGPQAAKPEAKLGFAAIDEASPTAIENIDKMQDLPAEITQTEEIANHPEVQLVHGPRLWCQQFDALFRKRALSVRRDRKAWASQLLLPSIFVFLALLTARILEVKIDEPALKLSTDMLSGTVWAGSAREIKTHEIPFSNEQRGDFSDRVFEAFQKGKGVRDSLDLLEGNSTMGRYLFDKRSNEGLGTSYGAISLSGEEQGQNNLTLWFRRQAYHGVPIMVNLWNNARLQLLGMEDSKVQVSSHPLPKTQQLLQEEMTGGSQVLTDLFVALTVILAMGFIPASFLVYLVHEKSSNGKHQQLLTGISPLLYWFGNYCWDVVNFVIPLILCVLIFLAFQVMAYSGDNLPAIIVVLFLYGACMTPLMYCVEPAFSVPSTAYVTLICLNIFTGTISTLAIAVLEAFDQEELKPILDFGTAVFPWALPNYCLGRSLLAIAVNHYSNFAYTEFGVCLHDNGAVCWKSPFSWDVCGKYLMHLAVMVPVWFSLRMLIEWDCLLRAQKKRLVSRALRAALAQGDSRDSTADEAVLAEQARIENERNSGQGRHGLVLDKLEKCFARFSVCSCSKRLVTFRAVRGISVGVPPGECFGLLGVNGAGKTTTMRMITGDTEVTKGDVLVGGASVQAQRDAARRRLGYCPQFDAIPDKLTVRETIQLFARIRGVPRGDVRSVADTMIARMCLEAHENQLCEFLSGGNKRKLSTALALIGEPDVVLLDEPSTGVDVGARRFLWEVIGDIRRSGHAVVLTSHSMEECEVLCTRLTIMVHGQFRCLGSPIELKARYGGGYSLSVKSLPGQEARGTSTEDNLAQIRSFVKKQVPWARLAEVSVGLLRYRLGSQSDKELPLAEVFRRFEEASKGELEGCISDYSISQTSLEEVFLHFSKEAGVVEDPEIALEEIEDSSPRHQEEPPVVLGRDEMEELEEPVGEEPSAYADLLDQRKEDEDPSAYDADLLDQRKEDEEPAGEDPSAYDADLLDQRKEDEEETPHRGRDLVPL